MAQSGEEYAEQLAYVASGRARGRSLRPLRQLLPFLYPYRWRIIFAAAALIVSSGATLVVPAAVRQLIDHVYKPAELAHIARYFLAFLAAAAVLGAATAVGGCHCMSAGACGGLINTALRLGPRGFSESTGR